MAPVDFCFWSLCRKERQVCPRASLPLREVGRAASTSAFTVREERSITRSRVVIISQNYVSCHHYPDQVSRKSRDYEPSSSTNFVRSMAGPPKPLPPLVVCPRVLTSLSLRTYICVRGGAKPAYPLDRPSRAQKRPVMNCAPVRGRGLDGDYGNHSDQYNYFVSTIQSGIWLIRIKTRPNTWVANTHATLSRQMC